MGKAIFDPIKYNRVRVEKISLNQVEEAYGIYTNLDQAGRGIIKRVHGGIGTTVNDVYSNTVRSETKMTATVFTAAMKFILMSESVEGLNFLDLFSPGVKKKVLNLQQCENLIYLFRELNSLSAKKLNILKKKTKGKMQIDINSKDSITETLTKLGVIKLESPMPKEEPKTEEIKSEYEKISEEYDKLAEKTKNALSANVSNVTVPDSSGDIKADFTELNKLSEEYRKMSSGESDVKDISDMSDMTQKIKSEYDKIINDTKAKEVKADFSKTLSEEFDDLMSKKDTNSKFNEREIIKDLSEKAEVYFGKKMDKLSKVTQTLLKVNASNLIGILKMNHKESDV